MEYLEIFTDSAMAELGARDPFWAYVFLLTSAFLENVIPPVPGDAVVVGVLESVPGAAEVRIRGHHRRHASGVVVGPEPTRGHVGSEVAEVLARHFGTIDALMAATEEDLTVIPSIGPKIAATVVAYFENESNRRVIEKLRRARVALEDGTYVYVGRDTGKIEAVVGVSCINVLEKCFPHMEAAAVPGVAIPLLQDDCINTTVDLDWVWDLIHLTSDDKTYRLDLDTLKTEVRGWFATDSLDAIMGAVRNDDQTEQIARDFLATGGKRWRPYLTTCTYMALESDRQEDGPELTSEVKKAAVAIECFHKASLIHDDIEDGDEQRYQRPTLHTAVGVPVALNVGDFLVGEGYRLLGEIGKAEMTAVAAQGHVTLSRGQGRELLWVRNPEPLPSIQVLEIFRQKTAAAFEVALRLGAILGGADEGTHNVLCKYSEALGIAYQIKDDLEDFKGDADSNDLEQVRLSLILAIAHKRAGGADKKRIAALIRSGAPEGADEVHEIVRELGVLDKTDDLLEAYKEEAIRSLRFLSSPTLKGLMRRIVGKIFGEKLIEGYCSEFEARNAASRATGAESASGSL
ncbi:MAG: polyprenyl synthetase [Candidatus Neomarinimicrobiota bacterium]|nr:MAG: polyprenyl synthetase [Candidatus Neomarinimicrobiota bacterium]